MSTLFDGRLSVYYGQAFVVSGPDFDTDLDASFRGQSNGLCGAASPNLLFLITGLFLGDVNFSVEFLDAEPPLDPAWEDVVEVSFTVVNRPMLEEWAGQASYPLDLAPGSYRVRYAARRMDAASEVDTLVEGEEPIDTYQLNFWPAERNMPDRVIRQESQTAAYWNGWANSLHRTS